MIPTVGDWLRTLNDYNPHACHGWVKGALVRVTDVEAFGGKEPTFTSALVYVGCPGCDESVGYSAPIPLQYHFMRVTPLEALASEAV